MAMGNLISGSSGYGEAWYTSEENSRLAASLRRIYGTTRTPGGNDLESKEIIRVGLPWQRQTWSCSWPPIETYPSESAGERIKSMSVRMSPDRYILGTVFQMAKNNMFRWQANKYALMINTLGEWEGEYRTELDAEMMIDMILKENEFKLLEEKHLLLA